MKSVSRDEARKRPVNLSLNEALVGEARDLSGNLSGVVESLLEEYVEKERQRRMDESKKRAATISTWNEFNAKRGSFADEYSTL